MRVGALCVPVCTEAAIAGLRAVSLVELALVRGRAEWQSAGSHAAAQPEPRLGYVSDVDGVAVIGQIRTRAAEVTCAGLMIVNQCFQIGRSPSSEGTHCCDVSSSIYTVYMSTTKSRW